MWFHYYIHNVQGIIFAAPGNIHNVQGIIFAAPGL